MSGPVKIKWVICISKAVEEQNNLNLVLAGMENHQSNRFYANFALSSAQAKKRILKNIRSVHMCRDVGMLCMRNVQRPSSYF